MSTGKLKPQYNRVRTSNALQTTSIWANTIGIAQEQGSNAAVEASIYAPSHGGGGRAARMQKAQNLVQASGFQPAVTDLAGLTALARAQGSAASSSRGACKVCGGLGHLTKQCRNFVPGAGGANAEGGAAAAGSRALLTVDEDVSSLSAGDLTVSSDSESDSSGSSGDTGKRQKRSRSRERSRSRDRKRHSSKRSSKGKKEKKDRKDKKHSSSRKESSKHKHKRSRRSRSPS